MKTGQRSVLKPLQHLATSLTIILALTACTKTIGTAFNATDAQVIQVGKSAKPDVIKTLGQPYRRTTRQNGSEVWTYLYRRDKDKLALLKALPVSKLIESKLSKAKVSQKTLDIGFKGGIVSACKLTIFEGENAGRSGPGSNLGSGNIKELNCGVDKDT